MHSVDCGISGSPEALILYGPTLKVQIGFDTQYIPKDAGRPNLANAEFNALIDTGAAVSCIDSSIADLFKLPIIDRQLISGCTEKVN